MTLKRNSIVRTDLPVVRRGYDRDAVDRHLERVADEVAALDDESRTPVATAASSQVRAILEAAESGAEQIRSEAEADASRIRNEASVLRTDASEEARGRIGEASDATAGIVERVEAVEREVDDFATRIRAGVSDVTLQLQRLQDHVSRLEQETAAADEPDDEPIIKPDEIPPGERETVETPIPDRKKKAPAAPDEAEDDEQDEPETAGEPDADAAPGDDGKSVTAPAATEAKKPVKPSAAAPGGGEQDEAARLVALDLALGGTERDDARTQLEEQFPGADHDGILDAVYASVG